jgi:hypothetical protein
MGKFSLLALIVLAMLGCAEKPEPLAEPPAGEQPTSSQAGDGGGVGVVSPASGAISPVTGSETVAGGSSGGSGVGQAAKNQAKNAASKAAGGSLDQYGEN